MRKKTIEEELKEIQEEKEDHIAQLEKEFGHDSGHRYDFSMKEEKKKSKKQNRGKAFENNTFETSSSSSENFTYADYKRMVQLEESELSDEEFDEYCNLMDRFAEAPNKDELYAQAEEDSEEEQDESSVTEKENLLEELKKQKQKSKIDAIVDSILEAKTESEDITPEEYEQLQKFNSKERDKDIDVAEYQRLVQKYNNSIKHGTFFQMLANKNLADKKALTGKASRGGFIFPILFLCIFVVAGLCVTIFAGIIPMTKYNDFVEVTAIVKEVETTYYDDDGDLHARMIVSFMFKGNADEEEMPYEVSIKTRVSRIPEPGVSTLKILVNPNNPNEVRDASSGNYIFPLIFGLVFAGFALFMQIMLISQAVKHRK